MERHTAYTAESLSLAAAKEALALLVKSGEIPEAHAKLIDLRELTQRELAHGTNLAAAAQRAAARSRSQQAA